MTALARNATPALMTDRTDGPFDYDDEEEEEEEPEGEERERRRLFERAVPDILRRVVERALESGVEKLTEGPDNIRNLLGDFTLPKEVVHYVYGQIDDTKKGIYRVVAKEIRDVLEHTNFADEIADVLTKVSFEVNTQIRFVPNSEGSGKSTRADGERSGEQDDAERTGGIPRPRVVSKVVMKARDTLERRSRESKD